MEERTADDGVLPEADEELATGWEPDLADDTLVRRAVEVHASWPLDVAAALGRPSRRTADWAGIHLADAGALANPVIVLRPDVEPGRLVAEVGELVPAHAPFFVLSAWQHLDFTPSGLALLGHPPLMVRLPGPTGEHGEHVRPAAHRPDGVRVREVVDAEGLAVAERVLVEGYPMPALQPVVRGSLLGEGLLGGDTHVYLAEVDGVPAAVAVAHHAGGLTLVEYVAALEVARGRGTGSAVTWAATLSDPARPAVLVASDDGRGVYERMGYVALERWSAWLRPGA